MVRRTFELSPSSHRRAVLGGLAVAGLAPTAYGACSPPRVLFVCPAGAVKSAIAREALKAKASRRGVAVAVQSRGVQPQDHMTPVLAASLAADGIDPKAEPVRTFSRADLAGADIVVAFDEAADDPRLRGARRWDVPSFRDYPAARAALFARLDALLDELSRRPCS